MRIVVLAGGRSPEREVSLASGRLVASSLASGHNVALVDLSEGLPVGIDLDSVFTGKFDIGKINPLTVNDWTMEGIRSDTYRPIIGHNVLELCMIADVVFVALHGGIGESGQLQAIFDCFGVRYTGSGFAASAVAMDKDIAKRLLVSANIPTPEWVLIDRSTDLNSLKVPFPCFVKPCLCGSSVGASMANNMSELRHALELAMKYGTSAIAEKRIIGREFSVGILDDKPLPVIEIVPKGAFYDYLGKYQKGLAEEVCPANLSHVMTSQVQEYAVSVHRTLRLRGYSRIDFMLNSDGEFYCLEANTSPGMTSTSLLPQEAAAAGIDYATLCSRMVRSAF